MLRLLVTRPNNGWAEEDQRGQEASMLFFTSERLNESEVAVVVCEALSAQEKSTAANPTDKKILVIIDSFKC